MTGAQESGPALRLAAIILFLGVPAVLASMTAINLLGVSEDRYAQAERTLQLASFQRRLDAPAADGRPFDTSPIYLKGASRSLAGATLQQQVVGAVAATAGRLIETVAIEPIGAADSDPADADSIRLKATLDIDNGGLLQLLFILESGVPLVDVETISIRRIDAGTGLAEAGQLRVDLTVRARWKQEEVG